MVTRRRILVSRMVILVSRMVGARREIMEHTSPWRQVVVNPRVSRFSILVC